LGCIQQLTPPKRINNTPLSRRFYSYHKKTLQWQKQYALIQFKLKKDGNLTYPQLGIFYFWPL